MSNTTDNLIPSDAPLAPEQAALLNAILSAADAKQAAWFKGFIASLAATDNGFALPKITPLTILFGSESGNAETLANRLRADATSAGFTVTVVDMADCKPASLAKAQNLLVLVSTWGEGDPPSRAEEFVDAIMGDSAPKLDGVNFSVLGLGDSSYTHFNKMGKDFNKRLEVLGGNRAYDLVECDVDFEASYKRWESAAVKKLIELAQPTPLIVSTTSAKAKEASKPLVVYSKSNPFPAQLLKRYDLNGVGSAKETIHAEISLADSGLTYEAGDALGVVPENAPDLIKEFLDAAKLDPRENVAFGDDLSIPFGKVLRKKLDLRTLNTVILKKYAKQCDHPILLKIAEDRAIAKDWIWGRDIVDLIKEYRSTLRAGDWVRLLRPLSPRLYSIASSISAHPSEVHLTVGAVRYESNGRAKKGTCSTFIADLWREDNTAGVYFHHNKNFKLPQNTDTPIIMVGPGTGIAPFRSFIEERVATGAKGENWLFFGDRNEATDYLYKEEFEAYLKDGSLTRIDLAFSRDQEEKIYVQDRMRENGAEIWAWLDKGGYFYVCGDAMRMAKDVHKALIDIIAEHGKMDTETATKYLKQMGKNRRYGRDVY